MHAFDVMQVCAALWNWCINKDTFITNLGDWCLTSTGLQANAPSNKYNFVSRASDYMLTHFKLFSEVSCSTSLVDDVVKQVVCLFILLQYDPLHTLALHADSLLSQAI